MVTTSHKMNQHPEKPSHLLRVENLTISFDTDEGRSRVVDRVSFALAPSSKTAVVGESGSGKTVTAMAIMGLLSCPPAHIEGGNIHWQDRELLGLSERQWRGIRGNEIAIVFQDPMSSLNPVLTVGFQLVEAIRAHQRIARRHAKARAIELLGQVGLDRPELRFRSYPHELSGGMRQRVLIAMALCNAPDLLIADEPTSALDVTTQAQILDLLEQAQQQTGMATLLVTHDLSVAATFADDIIVMYAGQIVEMGPVEQVLLHPRHPYTEGLLRSLPPPLTDTSASSPDLSWRAPMPGQMPPPDKRGPGCTFAPRCALADDRCTSKAPSLSDGDAATRVRCWKPLPSTTATSHQEAT